MNKDDSLAQLSVFSQLSFIQPTLRSMMTIPKRSRYYSKKIQRKREPTHATVNIVRCGDPIAGVASSNSSPENQSSHKNDRIYHLTRSKTRLAGENSSNSSLSHEYKGKMILINNVYVSSKISDSSYQRNVSVDATGDDVGSLLQRLKVQEELSKL